MNLFERAVELRFIQWQLFDPSERCHDFACCGRPEGVTARRICGAGSIELHCWTLKFWSLPSKTWPWHHRRVRISGHSDSLNWWIWQLWFNFDGLFWDLWPLWPVLNFGSVAKGLLLLINHQGQVVSHSSAPEGQDELWSLWVDQNPGWWLTSIDNPLTFHLS